ncbi:MAG: pilus assembly protein PilM [Phycisphaeraceae bacterium]
MAFGLTKTRYSPIAIDFGADSLKLLQVVAADPPQLVAAASAVVPEHARQDPVARQAFFADALKSLLRAQPFRGKHAVVALPAYSTLVQHLQIGRGQDDSIDDQIAIQLRQRLNIDPSRMVVRHFRVGPVVRDGATREEVICVASSRDSVMSLIQTANRAKLDVVGMSCEPLATLGAFAHLYRHAEDNGRTTCFLDIGAATTKVLIAHGREMVFAKTIHAAGDHLTRHRAGAQSLSFADARELRMREASEKAKAQPALATAGVAGVSAGSGASGSESQDDGVGLAVLQAQLVAARVAAAIAANASPQAAPSDGKPAGEDETIECLIDELQLCLRYHQAMYGGRPVEKLVFLGGEANHVATCQRIARALRIGAQLGDPLARVTKVTASQSPTGVDIRQPQPGWAVPLGLCLEKTS